MPYSIGWVCSLYSLNRQPGPRCSPKNSGQPTFPEDNPLERRGSQAKIAARGLAGQGQGVRSAETVPQGAIGGSAVAGVVDPFSRRLLVTRDGAASGSRPDSTAQ